MMKTVGVKDSTSHIIDCVACCMTNQATASMIDLMPLQSTSCEAAWNTYLVVLPKLGDYE